MCSFEIHVAQSYNYVFCAFDVYAVQNISASLKGKNRPNCLKSHLCYDFEVFKLQNAVYAIWFVAKTAYAVLCVL